jgi:hypothetical protein
MPCGEKNPELTVCQVRTATAALVRASQLGRRAARTILEAAGADIAYTQRRNAAARRSHTRTKLQVLAGKHPTPPPTTLPVGRELAL